MEITNNNISLITVKCNEIYGRYLVASKDIKEGEIILKDRPIVVGPKINSQLVCVNCYHVLLKKFHVCSKCQLAPLCSSSCEDREGDHTSTECKLFSVIRNKMPIGQLISSFHIVTVLRCLALRDKGQSKDWKMLMNLEDHCEKRRGTGIWELHRVTSKMIQNLDLLTKEDLELDIVQKIFGVLDVNSFELRAANNEPGTPGMDSVCGIYPTAALMAHSCICNTHLAIDDSYSMTIRASIPIQKDTAILFNYTNALQGTINRREHLREGKYFECNCMRCSDATELNTHMSSLKCSSCPAGMVTMQQPLNKSQYSFTDIWICDNCKHTYSGDDVKKLLDGILKLEQSLDKNDLKEIEFFISEASRQLPDVHYILMDAKQHLAGLLRDYLNTSTKNISKKIMMRKVELCKEFLPLLDKLEPGISRLKAVTLYEVYYPLVQISNKEYDAREISSEVLLIQLEEAEKYLKNSIKFLLFEPHSSPEGTLCRRAMEELRGLKKSITDIKKVILEEENIKILQKKKKNYKKSF